MMKKGMTVLLVGIAVMIACSGIATAGLMDTLGLGSKATALGGAFCAYADDPFAIYYNPAGLTQIDHFTVSNGVHIAYPSIKVNNFHVEGGVYKVSGVEKQMVNDGLNEFADISNKERIVPAPHFATAYPLSKKWVAGFAVYAPFGASAYWPETNNPGAYNSTFGSFTRIAATPTISYMLNDRLSFGFGLSIGATEVKAERIFYVPPEVKNQLQNQYNALVRNGSMLQHKIKAAIDADGKKVVAELLDPFNYSFNLGAMYRLSDKVTLGLTYRSRADVKVKGDVELEGLEESYGNTPAGNPIMSQVDGETNIDHPPQFQFGIRCQPSEDFSVMIDYVWTRWSIIDGYTMQLSPKLLDNREEENFTRDWKDTSQVRFGFEWVSDDFVTVRCGYYFDPSPVPDDTFDFGSSDVNKSVYSLGLGFNMGQLTIDTVFQYITSEDRESAASGTENEPLTASYEFLYEEDLDAEAYDQIATYKAYMQVWAFGITANYAF
jgi:long-chain fatty acid transport protein